MFRQPMTWIATGALATAAALFVLPAMFPDSPAPGVAAVAPPAPPGPRGEAARGGGAPIPAVDPAAALSDDPAPAAPPAPAAAEKEAAGSLRLRIEVAPESPRSGDAAELVATFENAGPGAVRFFVPEHLGLVPFPKWSLLDEDGVRHVPATPSFQSMWQMGLQGSIVELAAGKTWQCRNRVDAFAPVDPATGAYDEDRNRLALRPGRVIVSCEYGQATTSVPWSDKAFHVTSRDEPGLWTGTVRASDVAVQVLPSAKPSLTIDSPREAVPGKPYVVTATLENPGAEPLEVRGTLVCRVGTKAEGTIAETLLRRADAHDAETHRVEPGARLRFSADFAQTDVPPGDWPRLVAIDARFEATDAPPPRFEAPRPGTVSNLLFRTVAPVPDAAASGLRLLVTAHAGSSQVDVMLRNSGDRTLRVPRTLTRPASLRFEVRRDAAAGGDPSISVPTARGTFTASVHGWTQTERGGREPVPADFVELAPGESVAFAVDVAATPAPALPAGRYALTISWLNHGDGSRAGLAAGSVVVGRVSAEPATIER